MAGVPGACPATVTVCPRTGPESLNRQRSAYLPDPKSIVIGVTVPGPLFSISEYTAPLAGSTRSISAPPVPWLLIWMVCQPAPETDHAPPHWAALTSMTLDGLPPPELQAATVVSVMSAAPALASRRLLRITIRLSSGYSVPPHGQPVGQKQHRLALLAGTLVGLALHQKFTCP